MTESKATEPHTESAEDSLSRGSERRERFEADEATQNAFRHVTRRDGSIKSSSMAVADLEDHADLAGAYDSGWLRSETRPSLPDDSPSITVVDLFSGCGGMTLGVEEAARALEMSIDPLLAVDIDSAALEVYSHNFPAARTRKASVQELLGSSPGESIGSQQRRLAREIGSVQVLVGGPPCQGHSNLNNHSRRKDKRNDLFLTMARAAELFEPSHVIVENVRDIVHDEAGVFHSTCSHLEELGYNVSAGILDAEDFGVPQSRQRMFVVASLIRSISLDDVKAGYRRPRRSFDWACGDLTGKVGPQGFDMTTVPQRKTAERIDWLHDHDEWNLPDELRPPCHRNGHHSYLSVYGRIRPSEPAQTITTGFTCMGQGRFVHPHERRTITPHEAARLQFFPDFFQFGDLNREAYKRLIGNAVPPKFTYVLALELLR